MDYLDNNYPFPDETLAKGASFIKQIRDRLNLTQAELGKLLGFTEPKQIGLIESRKAKLRLSHKYALLYILNKDLMKFSFENNSFEVSGVKFSERYQNVSCKIFVQGDLFDYKEKMNPDSKTLVCSDFLWDKDIKIQKFKIFLMEICKGKKEHVQALKNHIDRLIETRFQDEISSDECFEMVKPVIPVKNQITGRTEAIFVKPRSDFYPEAIDFSTYNELSAVLKKDGLANLLQKVQI